LFQYNNFNKVKLQWWFKKNQCFRRLTDSQILQLLNILTSFIDFAIDVFDFQMGFDRSTKNTILLSRFDKRLTSYNTHSLNSNTQVTKTTSVLPVAEVIWDFGLPISISLFLRLLVGRVAGSIDGYAFVDLKKIRKLFLLFVKSTAIRFSKQIDKFVLLNLNHYEEQ
jgi:hypothetical protein